MINTEIADHLRMLSYHSDVLHKKMAERNSKRTQNNDVADNLPVITPEKANVNNVRLAPCCSCGAIDVVKRQRSGHICPRCKEANRSYTRKAKNNFQFNKTTRKKFLKNREMVEKIGCLKKEKILQR